jgi:hypothetical protein
MSPFFTGARERLFGLDYFLLNRRLFSRRLRGLVGRLVLESRDSGDKDDQEKGRGTWCPPQSRGGVLGCIAYSFISLWSGNHRHTTLPSGVRAERNIQVLPEHRLSRIEVTGLSRLGGKIQ